MTIQVATKMIPKYICLREAVEKGTTAEEVKVAWSRLSISEIKELTEGPEKQGQEKGTTEIKVFNEEDFSPLHEAVRYDNLEAVKFFLVSVCTIALLEAYMFGTFLTP